MGWVRLGLTAMGVWVAAQAGAAQAACRISDFTQTPLSQLTEVERLAAVTQLRQTEFNRLKTLKPGDPDYYALVSASSSLSEAKRRALEHLESAGVENAADVARTFWATNRLDGRNLQDYTLCIAKETVGIFVRGRLTAPGRFKVAFAHSRPIGVWPLPTALVDSENISNAAEFRRFLAKLGPQDAVNETFTVLAADPGKPARLSLKFGEERPRVIHLPTFPAPTVELPDYATMAAGKGGEFRDCDDVCPVMVALPGGTFLMGHSREEDLANGMGPTTSGRAAPVHEVTIENNFAIGKYPVTIAQYRAFVDDTGYQPSQECHVARKVQTAWVYDNQPGFGWNNPSYEITDNHPVVCVNFADVNAYIDWLSRKTGSRYRLPSDAEYEYAQRAGTTTPYWWGEDKDRTQACQHSNQPDLDYGKVWDPKPLDAHYRFQCHDGYAWTSPVGSFKPNPWGLYDMQGNIWHWVEDCWHDTYEGAPTDGSAWTSGDCDLRSSRGGSFGNAAWSARAGNRAPILNEYAGHSWGFRVVKEQ